MPKMIVTDENGQELRTIDAETGISLMENLRNNQVDEILAICGGLCACATCQIYLDDDSYAKTGAPGEVEAEMIEGSGVKKPTSRLSCQVKVTDELDGLRFSIAPVE